MAKNKSKRNLKLPYNYVYAKEHPSNYITEAYQKFIINLEFINLDGKYKVFQVTSSLGAEGKSTFIGNIAFLLAKKGLKVCVIDLDLRKPKIHRIIDVANEKGVSDYLSGKINLTEAIVKSSLGFDVMVRGENTDAVVNVLTSEKLKALLFTLKEKYDYILVDSPPVILVSDSLYIAKIVDATVFAISQSETSRKVVKEAVDLLKQNQVNIIGVIMLQVNFKNSSYGYGYGYGYSYEEDANDKTS